MTAGNFGGDVGRTGVALITSLTTLCDDRHSGLLCRSQFCYRQQGSHPGYAVSQWMRKRIEEGFGWMKTIGGLRKTRYRGRARVQWHAYLVAAAYNLLRIARLAPAPA
jgi:hypothetical protein